MPRLAPVTKTLAPFKAVMTASTNIGNRSVSITVNRSVSECKPVEGTSRVEGAPVASDGLQRDLARNLADSRVGGIAPRAGRRGALPHGLVELPRWSRAQSGRFWFSMYSLTTASGAPPHEPAK